MTNPTEKAHVPEHDITILSIGCVTEGYSGSGIGTADVRGRLDNKANATLQFVAARANGGAWQYIGPGDVDFNPPDDEPGWTVEGVGGVLCYRENVSSGENTIEARAQWLVNLGAGGYQIIIDEHSKEETGYCCPTESRPAPGNRNSDVKDYVDADERDAAGWYRFDSLLTAHPLSNGKILSYQGEPLRGSVIEMFASQVNWRMVGDSNYLLTRPCGTLQIPQEPIVYNDTLPQGDHRLRRRELRAFESFYFPRVSKGAICIYQMCPIGEEHVNVLSAVSADNSDQFGFDNSQPIRVRVNDTSHLIGSRHDLPNSGGFTLNVRIVVP